MRSLLFILAAAPRLAGAQATCDSTALRTPLGMRRDTLRLALRPVDGQGPVDRAWADLVLDAIATRFRVPQPLPLPTFGDLEEVTFGAERREVGVPALSNEIRVTFDARGRPTEVTLTTRSLADVADSALLAAIRDAGADGALPPLFDGDRKNVTTFLALRVGRNTMPVGGLVNLAAVATAALNTSSRPLAVLSLPLHERPTPVRPRPGMRAPLYPPDERAAGRNGDVLVSFVVSEGGRVEPGTVRVVSYTTPAFARSVFDVMKTARFEPATVGGCPVKQLVQQPFEFRLTGR